MLHTLNNTLICRAKADYRKAREDSTVSQDLLKDKEEGRIKKEQEEEKMQKQFDLIRNLDAHGNTEVGDSNFSGHNLVIISVQ